MSEDSPFVSALGNPSVWFEQAEELLEAAKRIRPEVESYWEAYLRSFRDPSVEIPGRDFMGVYFMLVAYAIENLCKGALVRTHSREFSSEARKAGRLPKRLKSHNLWHLTQSVGFVAAGEDEDLLRRLTKNSIWAGRYPVPQSVENADSEQFSDGKYYPTTLESSEDLEELAGLVERLRVHVIQDGYSA